MTMPTDWTECVQGWGFCRQIWWSQDLTNCLWLDPGKSFQCGDTTYGIRSVGLTWRSETASCDINAHSAYLWVHTLRLLCPHHLPGWRFARIHMRPSLRSQTHRLLHVASACSRLADINTSCRYLVHIASPCDMNCPEDEVRAIWLKCIACFLTYSVSWSLTIGDDIAWH